MGSVTVAQFHQLWSDLHQRAARDAYFVSSDAPKDAIEQQWLTRFSKRIRCGGCRKHWFEVIAKLPPDLSSRTAYFRWTVHAHNAINRRLGKPVMTLRAARQRWAFDTSRHSR